MKKPLSVYRLISPVFSSGNLKRAGILFLLAYGLLSHPLHVNAQSAPVFTINAQKITLEQLIDVIQGQSNYSFVYKDSEINTNTQISVDAKDKTVASILEQAFAGTGIGFRVNGSQIILNKQRVESSTAAPANGLTVKGFVYDPSGEPLNGVTVVELEANSGVLTDHDGYYSINVKGADSRLVFSFAGHTTQTVRVDGNTAINITLQVETSELDELVIVGYGTQKKATIVGSLSTIDTKDLDVPATNLSSAFAGRLAGVIAVQRSGEPGADGADFWIRGISSFNGGAQSPLIILDGVTVESGELNGLDPEMIESFSVLKDATATALYGTRGANGVMIVATKSGRNLDKPVVNVRLETSYNSPLRTPEFADGVQYMEMYNDAVLTRGGSRTQLYSDEKIYGTRIGANQYVFPNVNWYDEMFRKGSFSQNVNVTVRGGGARVDYFSSVSVNHDNGMLQNTDLFSYNSNISNMRYVLQNNINANLSKTTKLSLRLNVQLWDNHGPNTSTSNIFNKIMDANPVDFPIIFPQEDEYNYLMWGGKQGGRYNSSFENPYAIMTSGYQDSFASSITGNLGLTQRLDFITKGLSAEGLFSFKNYSSNTSTRSAGYNQFQVQNFEWNEDRTAVESYNLHRLGVEQGTSLSSGSGRGGDHQIYIQAMLNYGRTFGKHDVSAMALYNQEEFVSSVAYPFRKQGIAGRINYAFDFKYLLELNFGYNGSENFAKGHRFGFFPSVGVGYVISREEFFQPITHVVNSLKIRASWGLSGNDQTNLDRFLYRSIIELQNSDLSYVTGRDQNTERRGPKYTQYGNPEIGWEIGEKFNVGIDIGLFNCLNITLDFFKENRRNILMARNTVPAFIGITAKDRWMNLTTQTYANLGVVENKGFDIAVDYMKNINRDLSISFKGTFTYAANKILERDEPDFMIYPNLSQIGRPINQPLLYIAERLFIDDAEIKNSPTQILGGLIMPGDIKYTDLANAYGETDGTIDTNDRMYTGFPTVPQIVYGFGPSIRYKKWDFSLFFQGVARTSLMISGIHPFGTDYMRNVQTFIADDYWAENNQNIYAAYPRLSRDTHTNTTVASTYWQRDGSYIKLKNAEIGFSHRFFRVYVRGSNLLVFSKFKLWDPEQGSGSGMRYPTQRVANVGIQFKFN